MIAGRSDARVPAYSWYALFLLFLVNTFHVVDRQVFSILQDSIKRDLHLSDTALGLLSGFAFAIFYTTFGIPIARLADRRNRTRIVAAALAVWSAMTAVCGLATGFFTLALARVGVGIGESGCTPATHSLLCDHFPPRRRSTAFAILTGSTSIGLSLGFLLGGYFDAAIGWRRTLMILAAPGILLALIVALFLREPERGRFDATPVREAPNTSPRLADVLSLLWRIPTFRCVLTAYALHFFAVQGAGAWKASFFRRSFAAEGTATIGGALGIAAALGIIGVLGGGMIADRLVKRDKRWFSWLPVVTIILAMPFFIAMLFVGDWRLAVVCYAFDVGLNAAFTGPTLALLQQLVRPDLRALSSSLVLLAISLLGMGLGPVAIGALSDALTPEFGPDALRYALLSVVAVNVAAVLLYLRSARTVIDDLAD